MSVDPYEHGRKLGFDWATAYQTDLFDLQPIANGEPTPDHLAGEVANLVGADAVDNQGSPLWQGFRAGVAARLVDSGIIAASKRLLEWKGREFELPAGHRASLLEGMGEDGTETWIALSAGTDGSTHVVTARERREEVEVIHVGRQISGHVVGSGEPMKPVHGYPFPESDRSA